MGETPDNLNIFCRALWQDARGDWNKAHDLVGDLSGPDAAWVHAYLHRKEGDLWNADYWYQRANRSRPAQNLQEEWTDLVQFFLNK